MRCVLEVWQRFWDRVLSIRIKELIRNVVRNEVRFEGIRMMNGEKIEVQKMVKKLDVRRDLAG